MLQEELTKLDKRSEGPRILERIATGLLRRFPKKEKVTFSFEDELTALWNQASRS